MKKLISMLMCFCMVITVSSIVPTTIEAKSKKVKVSKPKISSVTRVDTTTLKIKWKKVSSVKGYQIYYKQSGGKYKKLATLGKSKSFYTHKKLKVNKKYFYKIRAYKVKNGKKYYSKFSSVKALKTTNYLLALTQPYAKGGECCYVVNSPDSFYMGSERYTNGLTIAWADYFCAFNLKGKYSKISFTCGNVDGYTEEGALHVLSDGECVKTIIVEECGLPKKYVIDIEKAAKLEFRTDSSSRNTIIGIGNIKVYK